MKKMIKPERLHQGDKVAIISLSSGMLGDQQFLHKYYLGKERLEEVFGLEVVAMPHALKGSSYLYEHPEKRAEDWMEACADPSIKAIITAIGGDDGVRLLPYVDFTVLRKYPKIFLGYSDTTIHHLMMHKASVVSFYGPALMSDFAEYGAMSEYTVTAIKEVLFDSKAPINIEKCPYWQKGGIAWSEENMDKQSERLPDTKGYETLQGEEAVRGRLIGGCIDAFPMYCGTAAWPEAGQWDDTILFLETSPDCPAPEFLTYYLRGLGAQGILETAHGIIVGKPCRERYYDEYKSVYRKVLKEFGREDLPVLYNVNFGHCAPIGILPYGVECELDVTQKKITLCEDCVI